MLAIVTVTLEKASKEGARRFVEAMADFAWRRHPLIEETFIAEFPESAREIDVIHTVAIDLEMSFGVAEAEDWNGTLAIVRCHPSSSNAGNC